MITSSKLHKTVLMYVHIQILRATQLALTKLLKENKYLLINTLETLV